MNRKEQFTTALLDSRNSSGFWEGQLSSSALAGAVSIIAFQFSDSDRYINEIQDGLDWLLSHQNHDGGYGDSPESRSNISTSLLCYSALYITRQQHPLSENSLSRLSVYLKNAGIDVTSPDLARHVLVYYQTDYTFSVPILATCALCGLPEKNPFGLIPDLPFELALLPRSFYRFLNLNVVSYAIPALVAVGIAIFTHKHSRSRLRRRAISRSLNLLEQIMPPSGGFLEAIPLTAFVALSLTKSGYGHLEVVQKGLDFLKRTQRSDGSWPIDIDLSTWVTTLSVKALGPWFRSHADTETKARITRHLLSIQNKTTHPFNGSRPGGWGWTNFSGSVPDCDDTPGAILALLTLNPSPDDETTQAILYGGNWLLRLQNGDGGFPTFSRGWGKLPFDQSCADLTGHAILALTAILDRLYIMLGNRQRINYLKSVRRAVRYLKRHQHPNGTWLPLWFGNQGHPRQQNPVYGTARVTAYLNDTLTYGILPKETEDNIRLLTKPASDYLLSAQNQDGSWGGDTGLTGSIEETALAVSALAGYNSKIEAVKTGLNWIEQQAWPLNATPVGLYFASLWYSEKLYPLVMAVEAFSKASEPENSSHTNCK